MLREQKKNWVGASGDFHRCAQRTGAHVDIQAGISCMVMALNGQRTAHFLQPVQASMSLNTENFSQPCRSSESKCRWHVGTHQPQPVQRLVSITGLGTGRDGFI